MSTGEDSKLLLKLINPAAGVATHRGSHFMTQHQVSLEPRCGLHPGQQLKGELSAMLEVANLFFRHQAQVDARILGGQTQTLDLSRSSTSI
ncbi:hypothetical protein XhyaCFBP1156_20785 [Xanthomonas hyacinthi]|uniref:Uncharacterized protein n=1 Tax=Xanthomonas hyacinthi TaxID=56455 RepID=A0A2S7ENL7_9XANT|nr:hypothetical protein XhyaCFBP1156_20785 [Xanthomonas hyacinthi]